MNNTAYIMGVVVGVAVVIIIALVVYKVSGNPWKGYYDERQELIRGRGYKYACFTLLILMAVDMLIEVTGFIDKLPVANEAIMFIFIIAGVLVYAIYSIMHDAYLGIGQNGKSYTVMIIFVIVVNLLSAVMTIRTEDVFEGGKFSTGVCMQLVCVVAFAAVLIAMWTRKAQIKRQEELEDAMEKAEEAMMDASGDALGEAEDSNEES